MLLNVERSSDRKNESGVFLSYLFFTPCKHVVSCKVLKTKAKRLQRCIKGEVKRSVSIQNVYDVLRHNIFLVLHKFIGYSTQKGKNKIRKH